MGKKSEKVGHNLFVFFLFFGGVNYLPIFQLSICYLVAGLLLFIIHHKKDSQINFVLSYCTNHFSTAQTMEEHLQASPE